MLPAWLAAGTHGPSLHGLACPCAALDVKGSMVAPTVRKAAARLALAISLDGLEALWSLHEGDAACFKPRFHATWQTTHNAVQARPLMSPWGQGSQRQTSRIDHMADSPGSVQAWSVTSAGRMSLKPPAHSHLQTLICLVTLALCRSRL